MSESGVTLEDNPKSGPRTWVFTFTCHLRVSHERCRWPEQRRVWSEQNYIFVISDVSYERRLWPRAFSLIRKETLKKRISNNECRRNAFYRFLKKTTERSGTTLRHSIFDILRFCGSLFNSVKFHMRFFLTNLAAIMVGTAHPTFRQVVLRGP